MIIFIFFSVMFLATFSLALASGYPFKKVVWVSFITTVAFTFLSVLLGAVVGIVNTVELDCQVATYDFYSVSPDFSTGYFDDGRKMSLPSSIEVVPDTNFKLVVSGKELFHKQGWWSSFDVLKYRRYPKKDFRTTLYIKKE